MRTHTVISTTMNIEYYKIRSPCNLNKPMSWWHGNHGDDPILSFFCKYITMVRLMHGWESVLRWWQGFPWLHMKKNYPPPKPPSFMSASRLSIAYLIGILLWLKIKRQCLLIDSLNWKWESYLDLKKILKVPSGSIPNLHVMFLSKLISYVNKSRFIRRIGGIVRDASFPTFSKCSSIPKIPRFPKIICPNMFLDFCQHNLSNLVGPKSRIMVSGGHGHDR